VLGAQFTHIIIVISALFACKKQFEYSPVEILMSIKKRHSFTYRLKNQIPTKNIPREKA